MAALPLRVHLDLHPICLRRVLSLYEDENNRTWIPHFIETGDVLQVLLRQKDLPIGHIAITINPLNSSAMAFMWTLQPGGQYMDEMCRYWRIVRHFMENGEEHMILELIDYS